MSASRRDEAVDVEQLDASVELDLGAELDGVRGDREIGLGAQARIADKRAMASRSSGGRSSGGGLYAG